MERRGEPPLSPDDAVRFVRVYEDLIVSGDRDAIWRFYVFENNIIEEDPSALKDPRTIDEAEFAEAQSVSFFEARPMLPSYHPYAEARSVCFFEARLFHPNPK